MSLHGMSGPSERAQPERSADSEPLVEHRIIRPRERVVVEGVLVCPGCELPILPPSEPVALGAPLGCGFCGEHAPAARFVRAAARDVPGNRVRLTARLP